MLDATKAFDRVRYCKLFKLLLRRNVNPLVLRLLLHMYTKQELQVLWGNVCSKVFSACNGVKQGGVLSPVLFAVYMDELLMRLKKTGIGCHIGASFLGALAYADDLTLLCPTLKSLGMLVRICEIFSDEYDVLFNGPKSQFLIFQGRDCIVELDTCISVNGRDVPRRDSADHLGHKISSVSDDSLVESAVHSFWRGFNLFMSEFGHLNGFVKCRLFMRYCCSYYGAPLWSLYSSGFESLCVAWRKALRSIWGIPCNTHCDIVAALSNCVPLELNIKSRFLRFATKCNDHKNSVVREVFNVAKKNPMSPFCRNMKNTMAMNEMYAKWYERQNEIIDDVNVIRELIDVREGMKNINYMNHEDILFIIESLCTT